VTEMGLAGCAVDGGVMKISSANRSNLLNPSSNRLTQSHGEEASRGDGAGGAPVRWKSRRQQCMMSVAGGGAEAGSPIGWVQRSGRPAAAIWAEFVCWDPGTKRRPRERGGRRWASSLGGGSALAGSRCVLGGDRGVANGYFFL
jgi:hypothetical protein